MSLDKAAVCPTLRAGDKVQLEFTIKEVNKRYVVATSNDKFFYESDVPSFTDWELISVEKLPIVVGDIVRHENAPDEYKVEAVLAAHFVFSSIPPSPSSIPWVSYCPKHKYQKVR